MKRLAWLACVLISTACGSDGGTALPGTDAGTATGGSGGGGGAATGGAGGASRGRSDGSIVDPGSGGTTGGSGGAGTGGSGGRGVDAGPKPDAGKDAQPVPDAASACDACGALVQAYADAIKQELACSPTLPGQCLKQTSSHLVCGCTIWVNSTVLTDSIRKKFVDMGCVQCTRFTACPAIACLPPPPAACVPVSAQAEPPGDRPIVAPPAQQGQCMAKAP